MSEKFANYVETTLSAAIATTGALNIPVVSATGFPSSPEYRVRIDDELFIVTSGAGTTTWGVVRGAEGTTAATHTIGTRVAHVLTADSLVNQPMAIARAGAGDSAIAVRQIGDSYNRFNVSVSGIMNWGVGTSAADVNLYRSGPGVLQTDDNLVSAGSVISRGMEAFDLYGEVRSDWALANSTAAVIMRNGPNPSNITISMKIPIMTTDADSHIYSTSAWSPVKGNDYLLLGLFTMSGGIDGQVSVSKAGLSWSYAPLVLQGSVPWGSGYSGQIGLYQLPTYQFASGIGTDSSALTYTIGATSVCTSATIAVIEITGMGGTMDAVQSYTPMGVFGGEDSGQNPASVYARSVTYADTPAHRRDFFGTNLVNPRKGYMSFAQNFSAYSFTPDASYTLLAVSGTKIPLSTTQIKYKSAYDSAYYIAYSGTGNIGTFALNPLPSGSSYITGIAGGIGGREVVFANISNNYASSPGYYSQTEDLVVFTHEDTRSAASNRILVPNTASYALAGSCSVTLKYDASVSRWRIGNASGVGRRPLTTIYTDAPTGTQISYTWIPADGMTYAVVEAVGGGGAGGGSTTTGSGQVSVGGGGGGGGYTRLVVTRDMLPTAASAYVNNVWVGGGGAGVSGAAGNDGQASFISCGIALAAGNSGAGGGLGTAGTASSGTGGAGGSQNGILGSVTVIGGSGFQGRGVSGAIASLGVGGASHFATVTSGNSAGAGASGTEYGGGGMGSYIGASTSAKAGGDGASGAVIITEYFD